jgi:type VI secretion system ImpA family protein
MGIWEHDLKEADWNRVSEICLECLEKRTKDLQIAAWLLESWIHLHGFAGVREGLRTIDNLCRAFWDTLHPSLEDPEYRISIFEWINDKLSLQLKFIPITNPPQASNWIPYSTSNWERACQFEQQSRKRAETTNGAKAADVPEVTIAEFQQSAALSPPQFYESLDEDLKYAVAACVELEALLDDKYGKDAPSLRGFRNLLESIESLIENFGLRKAAPIDAVAPPIESSPGPLYEGHAPLPGFQTFPAGPPIQSRIEAYQRLAEAAEFLLRTEPHSPTPYLVRKAIAWGNMTLDELLPELVRNEDALRETLKLLQIPPRKQPTSQNLK